jgi:hypothetical protein
MAAMLGISLSNNLILLLISGNSPVFHLSFWSVIGAITTLLSVALEWL